MLVSGIIHLQYVSVEEGAVMLVLVAMVQVPDDEVTTVLPPALVPGAVVQVPDDEVTTVRPPPLAPAWPSL